MNRLMPPVPRGFRPPRVKNANSGRAAFHAYDWYYEWMRKFLPRDESVFLVPCAATKPIHTSPLHRNIYQKIAAREGLGRITLVVSEPVVLIRYSDLVVLEKTFCYDFPPKFLSAGARDLFVARLQTLLTGKDIIGCLPRHHASLVDDAVGLNRWKNLWTGDLFSMMRNANPPH